MESGGLTSLWSYFIMTSLPAAVQVLQPLMDKLSQTCTESNIQDLTQAIKSMSPLTLQKLHSVLLVPLFGELLNTNHGTKIKLPLLDCVFSILKVIHLSDLSVIVNLLNVLMMQLFDKNSPTMICGVSEEMKLSTLHCTLAIIDNMTQDVKDDFYQKQNVPLICQISYTCIQIAESEKLRTLRVCALENILALLQVQKSGHRDLPPEKRKNIGDIFQFVLPGASAKLATIVAGDVTDGSHVILTAVWTLSSMIAYVMEDYDLEEVNSIQGMLTAVIQRSKIDVENKHQEQEVQFSKDKAGMQKLINSSPGRTLHWKRNVESHLVPYLEKIAALHLHSNPKVCREVARSSCLLLMRCPISLREGLPPLLDALIMLSVHEDTALKEESILLINKLQEFFGRTNSYNFLDLVEENFYMFLTRLPRLVQEDGGSRSAYTINLLTGYLSLLHSSIKRVLSSSVHLQKLTLSLLHSLTLDCSGINVGQEHTIRELAPAYGEDLKLPWVQFRFNCDGSALTSFRNLCSVVANPNFEAIEILGPQLLDTLLCVPLFQKESILAINLLLLTSAEFSNNHIQEFALTVLDSYLAPEFWVPHERLTTATSVNQLQNDVAIACLLAEGVGCCTQALGAEESKPLLLRVLYPLLERAGSANAAISLAGRRALTRISMSCGYECNLLALLADNMDYITHCMALRLRHSSGSGIFDALSMILQHSSPVIAIGLYNIVHSVLFQIGVARYVKSNDAHLRVFLTFARGVHKWLEPENSSKENMEDKVLSTLHGLQEDSHVNKEVQIVSNMCLSTSWDALHKFKEYQSATELEITKDSLDGAEILDGTNNDNCISSSSSDSHVESKELYEESFKKDIPKLAKLLVLVLQRCVHFLPVNVIDHQFLALETLQAGLLALEPYPDTLLPIVHQIWNPLVGRLHASQPPLIIRAGFRLLLIMAHTARDFLMSRTLREVIPQFINFLKKSVHHSRLQDQGAAFRYSQMYKTQLALLTGLGPLASLMQFRGQDFHGILVAALPYLSRYQPQPLQVACKSLVQWLAELDGDATWWALVTLWTPSFLTTSLQLPTKPHNEDCKENVETLLRMEL